MQDFFVYLPRNSQIITTNDMVYLFLANGFEEIEALATVDVLRRCGLQVVMTSVSDELCVEGAHGVRVMADAGIKSVAPSEADAMVLPGGMPGALNLMKCHLLCDMLVGHAGRQGVTAAICAAPFVLGELGLLAGRKATCYPGFEDKLKNAVVCPQMVVEDGHVITGRGPAAAIDFAFAIAARFVDAATIAEVRSGMLFG